MSASADGIIVLRPGETPEEYLIGIQNRLAIALGANPIRLLPPSHSENDAQGSATDATTATSDTDPNRRFNPDVLLTIAECLEDIKHYQSVISLSSVSRYFANSLKPFRERLRKRAILRLGDVDVDNQRGWSSVKFIECDRNSSYPIPRDLSPVEQDIRKAIIKSALKPSVIRYMGNPHECAFRLQQELFPTATVMRFIDDPFAQNLASVFPSKSTKAGENSNDLFLRMVPPIRSAHHGHLPATASTVRAIEYLKKGFEFRDLNSLPHRQIQSTIRVRTNDGLNYYRESCETYDVENGAMQSLLASKFLTKTFTMLGRTDIRKIEINVYLKHTPHFPTDLLYNELDDHSRTFESIYDSLQAMAQKNLSYPHLSTVKFQLYFIHGESTTSRTPEIRRPDHRRYERPGYRRRIRYRENSYDEDYQNGGANDWETDEDEDEDEDDEVINPPQDDNVHIESLRTSPAQGDEQKPVLAIEFTKSHGKVRATETTFDKDVLECDLVGGCSRCRPPVAV